MADVSKTHATLAVTPMSNNDLAAWIIILLVATWLPGLFIPRDNKWCFALWFPLMAASIVGTLTFLFSLGLLTQGGWEAVGGLIGILFTFPCIFLLAINLWYRPRVFAPLIVVPTVAVCTAGVVLFSFAPSRIDRNPVIVHISTVDGNPVANAMIEYKTYSKENGFSPSIQGKAETDSKGNATLYTRRLHDLDAIVKKNGFAWCSFQFRPSFRFGYHQTAISWHGAAHSAKYEDRQSAMIDVQATAEPEFTLYLPRKGIDTWLPYPPYEPKVRIPIIQ